MFRTLRQQQADRNAEIEASKKQDELNAMQESYEKKLKQLTADKQRELDEQRKARDAVIQRHVATIREFQVFDGDDDDIIYIRIH